jgi:hypothetical protein
MKEVPRRYTIEVTPVERGHRWGVRLALLDGMGSVINNATVGDLLFETAAEAEAAGWRLADDWIRRLTAGGRGRNDDHEPITPAERQLLVACRHAIARCEACRLHHNFFELYADRYCARCRGDLLPELRRHLHSCPEIVVRRAIVATETSQTVFKENRQIRESAGVVRAESEALRAETRRGRARRQKSPGRMCPMCQRGLEPGEPVSFRQGVIVHLACYEARRAN